MLKAPSDRKVPDPELVKDHHTDETIFPFQLAAGVTVLFTFSIPVHPRMVG